MNIGTKIKFNHEGKALRGYILELKTNNGVDVATVRVGRRLITVAISRLAEV